MFSQGLWNYICLSFSTYWVKIAIFSSIWCLRLSPWRTKCCDLFAFLRVWAKLIVTFKQAVEIERFEEHLYYQIVRCIWTFKSLHIISKFRLGLVFGGFLIGLKLMCASANPRTQLSWVCLNCNTGTCRSA